VDPYVFDFNYLTAHLSFVCFALPTDIIFNAVSKCSSVTVIPFSASFDFAVVTSSFL